MDSDVDTDVDAADGSTVLVLAFPGHSLPDDALVGQLVEGRCARIIRHHVPNLTAAVDALERLARLKPTCLFTAGMPEEANVIFDLEQKSLQGATFFVERGQVVH